MISMVVAAADNNAIGKDNQLLWHLPGDMKFFKNTTWAMPVIMGRNTFESLGKPLSGRMNVVITSKKDWTKEGVTTASSLEDAIQKAGEMKTKEIFVIGGGQVYKEAMSLADRIYLTRVHASPDADAFFPEINSNEWKLVAKKDVSKDARHAYDHSFQVWDHIADEELDITV